MGFRFSKRINLCKGLGINISRSGINPSIRTKFGSIGTNGFSVNGRSGFGYRKTFRNSGCLLLFIVSFILFQFLSLI